MVAKFFGIGPTGIIFGSTVMVVIGNFFGRSIASLVRLLVGSFPRSFASCSCRYATLFGNRVVIVKRSR